MTIGRTRRPLSSRFSPRETRNLKKAFLAAFAAAAILAGCTTPDTVANGEPATDKVYRTGTNLPERERMGVTGMSAEEFERQRASNVGTTLKDPGKLK